MQKPEQKLTRPQKLKNFMYEYKWSLIAFAITIILAIIVIL